MLFLLAFAIGSSCPAQELIKKYQSQSGLNWFNDTMGFGFKGVDGEEPTFFDLNADGTPELVLEKVDEEGRVTGLVAMSFKDQCNCDLIEALGLNASVDWSALGVGAGEPTPLFVGFASVVINHEEQVAGGKSITETGPRQALFVSGDPVNRLFLVDLVTGQPLFIFPQLASNKVGSAGALRFAVLDVDGDEADDFVVGDPETRTVQVWGAGGAGTATEEQIEAVLARLIQNFPNPFRASTTIPYAVERPAEVSLEVFDVMGRRVRHLFREDRLPGAYTASWDGTDDIGKPVASGSYFYQLRVGDQTGTKQMIRID